jgi:predicted CXXCH cytochrome family protein
MLSELAKPFLHKPIEQGSCTGCHDPHAANEPKFLVQSRATLCDKCHEIVASRHMHKTGILPKTEFPPGTPVSAEGTSTCYTCHFFHASNQAKLWRGPRDQCGLGCHEALDPQKGPAGEGGSEEKTP